LLSGLEEILCPAYLIASARRGKIELDGENMGQSNGDRLFEATGARTIAPIHKPRRIQLTDGREIKKGFLVGRARVVLPNGLDIDDIGVFAKEGRIWAQLPAQPLRDADGKVALDDRGKARYVSPIRWATKSLQDDFSIALVALIREQNPDAFKGVQ